MQKRTKTSHCTSIFSITASLLLALSGCSDKSSPNTEASTTSNITKIAANTMLPQQQPLAHYLERDVKDDIFYFVMPDRFYNGDSSNDLGNPDVPISYGGFDPTNKRAYHGGDMQGLKQKLPYLKEMGISAIWMTPILRNQAVQGETSGYHGYWVLDFTEIDPHLGSNADLKDLIDTAHEMNIKVFFDIITNHTADVIKYKECHGDDGNGWSEGINSCSYISLAEKAAGKSYTTVFSKGTENIKVPAWLNDPKYYNNQGDTSFEGENSIYGDFAGLDDIDTTNPEVVNGMIEIFKNIVSQFKPDGFRIDTVKHVNIEFWQSFSPAIIEHAKSVGIEQFFMFGEVYSFNPAELASFTTTGKLPSVLDFAFQGAVNDALVNQTGTQVLQKLFEQDSLYKDNDSSANELLTFTGNHDMGRFGYFLNSKNPNMNEDEKLSRIKLAHALMYFSRGIPVVYYGDEQGFTGDGNDTDSRQNMMASQVASYNDDNLIGSDATTAIENFDQGHPIYQDLAKLAQITNATPALRSGEQSILFSSNEPGGFVIARTSAEGDSAVAIFNTANEAKTIEFTLDANTVTPIYSAVEATLENNTMRITLPGLSYAVYQK